MCFINRFYDFYCEQGLERKGRGQRLSLPDYTWMSLCLFNFVTIINYEKNSEAYKLFH